MERIEHITNEMESIKTSKSSLLEQINDLEEQNRDLTFFISSSEKLKEAGDDVKEGNVTVADAPSKKKGKGKGRR